MLTVLRSTRARVFIPFDDNINFYKIKSFAIAIGILLHVGNHMLCDFPRLVNASADKFALITTYFHGCLPHSNLLFLFLLVQFLGGWHLLILPCLMVLLHLDVLVLCSLL